jgi:hypothetical protein
LKPVVDPPKRDRWARLRFSITKRYQLSHRVQELKAKYLKPRLNLAEKLASVGHTNKATHKRYIAIEK